MTEIIALSQKELSRARVLSLVTEGHLSSAEAAERMGVSERQASRLLKRFEESMSGTPDAAKERFYSGNFAFMMGAASR